MRFLFPILAVFAALAPSTHASAVWPPNLNGADLSKIEDCAIPCLADGFHESGCRNVDLPCLCSSQPFIDKLKHCAKRSCRPHEYEWTKETLTGECKKVGINICLIDDVAISDCNPQWNPFAQEDCRKRKFGLGRTGCVPPS